MKTHFFNSLALFIFFVSLFSAGVSSANSPVSNPDRFDLSELRFSEYKCSINGYSKSVLFVAQAESLEYYFRQNGFSVATHKDVDSNSTLNTSRFMSSSPVLSSQDIELVWDGINSQVEISGAERLPARQVNYPNGIDCKEKTYRKLYYNQLYPGIDLMYKDRADQLEMDLEVQAGFDYKQIKLHFEEAINIQLDALGRLIIESQSGKFYLDKVLAHQDGKPLLAKWTIENNQIGIELSQGNPSKSIHLQTVMQPVKIQL